MIFRLSPRGDAAFYDQFAASADLVVEGVRVFTSLLGAPSSSRGDLVATMRELEHRQDEITHAINERLGSAFVTPIDPEDIRNLAGALDDCMDHMDSAVDLIDVYDLDVRPAGLASLAEVIGRMAELSVQLVTALRSMSGTHEFIVEINRLENEANRRHRRLLADLLQDGADPIHVLKVKSVLDEFDAIADAFERLAHTVEGIVLRES